jgi:hypothetical protein
MSVFICDDETCTNVGLVYDFGDESPVYAMCGGCKERLEPNND